MIPSQIAASLHTLLELRQPVFLWGAPGVGKSQLVRQVAEQSGIELCDIRAILLDPVDLRGLPRIDADNRAAWCVPSFLPTGGRGVMFLDELNAAPPLVQAACYQLVLDRKLGEYELPEGWAIVAAGNRETDRAVTHRMPSALANRFVHLDFEADLDDWVAWAYRHTIPGELIAFLRFRPELLHSFDPTRNEKAFPSPRSWEFVGKIMQANPDKAIFSALISGTVGQGAAAELTGFLRVYENLPDVDAVLAEPGNAAIPDDPATLYALCQALAYRANVENAGSILSFALRLPPEFSILLARDSVRKYPALVEHQDFECWAKKHVDILM